VNSRRYGRRRAFACTRGVHRDRQRRLRHLILMAHYFNSKSIAMASSPQVMVLRLKFGSRAMPNLLHSHRKRTGGAAQATPFRCHNSRSCNRSCSCPECRTGSGWFFYRLMIEEMIANEDWRKSLFLHSANKQAKGRQTQGRGKSYRLKQPPTLIFQA